MEKYWDISLFVIAVFAILTAVVAITCARRSHKDNDEIFGFFCYNIRACCPPLMRCDHICEPPNSL